MTGVKKEVPEDRRLPANILSAIELDGLAALGAQVGGWEEAAESPWEWSDTPPTKEELEERARETRERARALQERRDRAVDAFRHELMERLGRAYDAGSAAATDSELQRSYSARSRVLFLVVLAVVAMPIIAILVDLEPQAFGTFIAPVTGIAGTVVGYWFGTVDRRSPTPGR